MSSPFPTSRSADGRARRWVALALLVAMAPVFAGCYGNFPLTSAVYEFNTDLADSEPNRETLIARAREADLLVCESAFRLADAQQARDTGHLTTRACAEIAVQARARRLLPFHFSKRYTRSLDQTYAELTAACEGVPLVTSSGHPDGPDSRDE